ncbi:MAG: hypothetical protein WDM90_20555 [Ferruginibacter sp.]
MGYNVEDVATPRAFKKDPQLVLNFYNERRRDVAAAKTKCSPCWLSGIGKRF